jgi:hypothetical protein
MSDEADYLDVFVPVTFPEINFVKVEIILKDRDGEEGDEDADDEG